MSVEHECSQTLGVSPTVVTPGDESLGEQSPGSCDMSGSTTTSHLEQVHILLAHKQEALRKFPNPPEVNGFPPVKLMHTDDVQKAIGYKEKRVPMHMRNKTDKDFDPSKLGSISRNPSNRSFREGISRDASSRSIPREMSRRKKMEDRFLKREDSRSKGFDGGSPPLLARCVSAKEMEEMSRSQSARFIVPSNLLYSSDHNESDFDRDLAGRLDRLHVPGSQEEQGSYSIQLSRRASTQSSEPRVPEMLYLQGTRSVQGDGRGRSASPCARGGDAHTRSFSAQSNGSKVSNGSGVSNVSQKPFANRKERAAFFIGLKNGSRSRSPSPWGGSDNGSKCGGSRTVSPRNHGNAAKSGRSHNLNSNTDMDWRSSTGAPSLPNSRPGSQVPSRNSSRRSSLVRQDTPLPQSLSMSQVITQKLSVSSLCRQDTPLPQSLASVKSSIKSAVSSTAPSAAAPTPIVEEGSEGVKNFHAGDIGKDRTPDAPGSHPLVREQQFFGVDVTVSSPSVNSIISAKGQILTNELPPHGGARTPLPQSPREITPGMSPLLPPAKDVSTKTLSDFHGGNDAFTMPPKASSVRRCSLTSIDEERVPPMMSSDTDLAHAVQKNVSARTFMKNTGESRLGDSLPQMSSTSSMTTIGARAHSDSNMLPKGSSAKDFRELIRRDSVSTLQVSANPSPFASPGMSPALGRGHGSRSGRALTPSGQTMAPLVPVSCMTPTALAAAAEEARLRNASRRNSVNTPASLPHQESFHITNGGVRTSVEGSAGKDMCSGIVNGTQSSPKKSNSTSTINQAISNSTVTGRTSTEINHGVSASSMNGLKGSISHNNSSSSSKKLVFNKAAAAAKKNVLEQELEEAAMANQSRDHSLASAGIPNAPRPTASSMSDLRNVAPEHFHNDMYVGKAPGGLPPGYPEHFERMMEAHGRVGSVPPRSESVPAHRLQKQSSSADGHEMSPSCRHSASDMARHARMHREGVPPHHHAGHGLTHVAPEEVARDHAIHHRVAAAVAMREREMMHTSGHHDEEHFYHQQRELEFRARVHAHHHAAAHQQQHHHRMHSRIEHDMMMQREIEHREALHRQAMQQREWELRQHLAAHGLHHPHHLRHHAAGSVYLDREEVPFSHGAPLPSHSHSFSAAAAAAEYYRRDLSRRGQSSLAHTAAVAQASKSRSNAQGSRLDEERYLESELTRDQSFGRVSRTPHPSAADLDSLRDLRREQGQQEFTSDIRDLRSSEHPSMSELQARYTGGLTPAQSMEFTSRDLHQDSHPGPAARDPNISRTLDRQQPSFSPHPSGGPEPPSVSTLLKQAEDQLQSVAQQQQPPKGHSRSRLLVGNQNAISQNHQDVAGGEENGATVVTSSSTPASPRSSSKAEKSGTNGPIGPSRSGVGFARQRQVKGFTTHSK